MAFLTFEWLFNKSGLKYLWDLHIKTSKYFQYIYYEWKIIWKSLCQFIWYEVLMICLMWGGIVVPCPWSSWFVILTSTPPKDTYYSISIFMNPLQEFKEQHAGFWFHKQQTVAWSHRNKAFMLVRYDLIVDNHFPNTQKTFLMLPVVGSSSSLGTISLMPP